MYCRRKIPLSSIDDDDDNNYASSLLSSLILIVLGLITPNHHGYHQTVAMTAMVLPTEMCIIMVKKVAGRPAARGWSDLSSTQDVSYYLY